MSKSLSWFEPIDCPPMDAIVVFDAQWQVRLINKAAQDLFGCEASEVNGRRLDRFLPGISHHLTARCRQACGCGMTPADSMATPGPCEHALRADGTKVPVQLTVSCARAHEQCSSMVIIRPQTGAPSVDRALHDASAWAVSVSNRLGHDRDDEQRRLAASLHHEVGESLAALRVDLALLRAENLPWTPAGLALLDRLDQLSAGSVAALRRVVADMVPPVLKEQGLWAALDQLAAQMSARAGISCTFNCHANTDDLDPGIAVHLYRIAQEALAITLRLGSATRVTIAIDFEGGEFHLGLQDDGSGFDPTRPGDCVALGLAAIRGRVQAVGGYVCIDSGSGSGTRIDVHVPQVTAIRVAFEDGRMTYTSRET